MAKSARYRWQNERKRGLLFPKPRPKKKKAGISNKQAQYLANLQRRLGVPYSGNGLTRAAASAAITEAKAKLGVGRRDFGRAA